MESESQLQVIPQAMVVEARGCTLKKDFYVKELAFVNTQTQEHWVGTFQPALDKGYLRRKYVRKIDREVTEELGLDWKQGQYPYQVAFTMINFFGQNMQLYALGSDLCHWIQHHTSICVVNLEELFGCQIEPPQEQLVNCEYHCTLNCALNRAMYYSSYLRNMFSLK